MSNIPSQTIILAGGRGTRLGQITESIPKPMVRFHDVPFLEYILRFLQEQGCRHFLLLLGYKAENIIEYFGDGSSLGCNIQYHVSDTDNETGRRLQLAVQEGLIEDEFLLMYCDNYCPISVEDAAIQWRQSGLLAQFTVYQNTDGYTKSNLRVEQNIVTLYDKSRTTPNLHGVEIGFLFAKKSVLQYLSSHDNPSLEKTVFPALIAQGQLGAYLTEHRYYSVGNIERLALTEQFLRQMPTIFLDRDGVLNTRPPQGCYTTSWNNWHWEEGAIEAITLLSKAGYRLLLVTNQAGVARGYMTIDDVEDIHAHMLADIETHGGKIEKIYYCPHGWDEGCRCRKPDIGMFLQAQRDFHLDLSKTIFIGDDERDGMAANNANCGFYRVNAENSLLDIVKRMLG